MFLYTQYLLKMFVAINLTLICRKEHVVSCFERLSNFPKLIYLTFPALRDVERMDRGEEYWLVMRVPRIVVCYGIACTVVPMGAQL